MKEFFEFDRRKKDSVVNQVVNQFIAYVNDYKLINGTPLPDLKRAKKEFEITEKEIQKIISELTDKGYLKYIQKDDQYVVHSPAKKTDFLINVAPAYRAIINSGKKPAVHTIEKKEIVLDAALANTYQMPIGERVLHYRRYLTADDVPMFYIDFCLSLDRLPGLNGTFKDNEPHLDFVLQKYSSQYKYHVREISIVTAPADMVKCLYPHDENMICTLGKYKFFNSKGEIVESGFAYMTELTEFTTTTIDLTELLI
jgi:DNA-binding GntR family transcriptional regulator